MSQSTAATTRIGAALPPEYSADAAGVKEALPPDMLRFAGRFIHSAGSARAESGLYEINSQIDFLRETDRKVEFSRIDYQLSRRRRRRTDSDADADATVAVTAAPETIVARPKHAFDIERPPAVLQEPFAYYLRPVSRSGLGLVGVRFAKVGRSLCKAWHLRRKAAGGYETRELLFDARPNNGVVDWLDGAGARLAVEEREAGDGGPYSLNVLTPLDRARRDALVATWCVRRWEAKAVEFHQKRTWKERKRIMETCTLELPGRGGTINTARY